MTGAYAATRSASVAFSPSWGLLFAKTDTWLKCVAVKISNPGCPEKSAGIVSAGDFRLFARPDADERLRTGFVGLGSLHRRGLHCRDEPLVTLFDQGNRHVPARATLACEVPVGDSYRRREHIRRVWGERDRTATIRNIHVCSSNSDIWPERSNAVLVPGAREAFGVTGAERLEEAVTRLFTAASSAV